MRWNKLIYGFVGFTCILMSSWVLAYDQPTVNLGYTSFLDGSPPSGPGLYFQDYFQYYTANRLTDKNGKTLPFPRTDLNATANITQLVYVSTKKILGGNLGFSVLLPWLLQVSIHDGLINHVLRAQNGPSDLFIGPALQFDPIMRKDGKGPLFVQRFDFDIVVPVGRYNPRFTINPSTDFWSLDPYWAATLWLTPKWAAAARIHYLWNAKSKNPNVSFGPYVHSIQAGQAIFGDLATDYAVTEQLHIGINGYFFDQFTDTRVDGVNTPGRREKVWAIGPGMLYGFTKNQFLFVNLYFEQGARNRPEGIDGILRYVIHF